MLPSFSNIATINDAKNPFIHVTLLNSSIQHLNIQFTDGGKRISTMTTERPIIVVASDSILQLIRLVAHGTLGLTSFLTQRILDIPCVMRGIALRFSRLVRDVVLSFARMMLSLSSFLAHSVLRLSGFLARSVFCLFCLMSRLIFRISSLITQIAMTSSASSE
jgi:hypothetical protein